LPIVQEMNFLDTNATQGCKQILFSTQSHEAHKEKHRNISYSSNPKTMRSIPYYYFFVVHG